MTTPENCDQQRKIIRDKLRLLNSMPDRDTNALVPGHMIERPDSEAHYIMKTAFCVEVSLKPQNQRLTFTPEELQHIRARQIAAHKASSLLSTVVDDMHHTKPQPHRPERDYRG